MQLPQSVQISFPGRGSEPVTRTFSELPLTLIDDSRARRVLARLSFCPPLLLWEGETYDAVGDYTQAQAEARVLELLGPNLQTAIAAMFEAARPVR
jgi:hypothetical protein